MNLTLEGRVALVTGANGGLGAHFAETLANAGAKVALCARRVDTLADVATRIRDSGGTAHEVALDVTRRDSVVSAFENAARGLGPVTVVVNISGRRYRENSRSLCASRSRDNRVSALPEQTIEIGGLVELNVSCSDAELRCRSVGGVTVQGESRPFEGNAAQNRNPTQTGDNLPKEL